MTVTNGTIVGFDFGRQSDVEHPTTHVLWLVCHNYFEAKLLCSLPLSATNNSDDGAGLLLECTGCSLSRRRSYIFQTVLIFHTGSDYGLGLAQRGA